MKKLGNKLRVKKKTEWKKFRIEIKDGSSKVKTELGLITQKSTTKDSKHQKLFKTIQHLKEVRGKSLNEICEVLNSKGLTPINGGKWYKSKLSSFYKYTKITIQK